ncbi:reverse transcriptase (RNA-dependent DNA polymerase) [Perkinsela sp. CCAP 1560/4]|nr:reverse transcriptase (RNA-dependent DNA polymerase) [Perkinsela sp. CCAP 1560/4]|eukprot:KNH05313.1 reverse transcriptase (RNA-dependent DNA polymerase) [Perkinsela sp. CCAP 1560/4]
MDVNVGKTNVCHFRSRRDAPVFRYRGMELENVETPKLLGVTFSKHRGFRHHTKSMKNKSQKTLLKFSAVSNTLLGASRDAIRCFHLALVSSSMQYACPAWFGIASDTDLATMDSVQARGARLACGLPATTNTYDSLLEANLPPVSEKAKLLAYKSFLVSSLHGGSRAANVASCVPPSSEIGKLHTEITEAYGSVEPLTDAPELNHRILIRPWTLQAVTKEMADAVKKRASDEAVAHRHPADYELWTDGSYVAETSSVAGAVLIFAKGKESCKTVSVCGKGRSSFRSECLALHAGLARVIADRTLSRGQRLLIASDSQSLLMALRRHTARSTTSTFAGCVEMLNALAGRGVKIRLQFVFGHCGVSRNELADVASNAAHGCSTRYTLWHKDALSIARERIAGDASRKLEARETHRRRVVGIKPTKTKHLTSVRLLGCLASQARTNWSPYWGDLHRILNPSVDKCCRFCSDPPAPSPLNNRPLLSYVQLCEHLQRGTHLVPASHARHRPKSTARSSPERLRGVRSTPHLRLPTLNRSADKARHPRRQPTMVRATSARLPLGSLTSAPQPRVRGRTVASQPYYRRKPSLRATRQYCRGSASQSDAFRSFFLEETRQRSKLFGMCKTHDLNKSPIRDS